MTRKRITNLCTKCGLAKTRVATRSEPQRDCPHFRKMARRRARSTIPLRERCQICGSTNGCARAHFIQVSANR